MRSADDADPVDLDVQVVTVEGLRTRVTRVQTAATAQARESFVLVAGIGVAATYFELLAPALAQRGRVFALDLPGFAGMPAPAASPSVGLFARQVDAVIDRLGLDDPVLIGHSFGAQVVAEVLAGRGGLTRAVLVGPVVDDRERSAPRQAVRFVQSAVHEPPHLALLAASAYLLCGIRYFVRVLPHMLGYPLADRLRCASARVLLVRGTRDRSSPRAFHSRLVAATGAAWRWEIDGAAHSVINADALGVASLVSDFVDGTLARRGQMPASEARVPPPRHASLGLVVRSIRYRIQEWLSARGRDQDGVENAKEAHAQAVWAAFTGGP